MTASKQQLGVPSALKRPPCRTTSDGKINSPRFSSILLKGTSTEVNVDLSPGTILPPILPYVKGKTSAADMTSRIHYGRGFAGKFCMEIRERRHRG
ncbi:hypothetical protein E2C01_060839 [Portunus trituberculatus]|uniref:Uncharacterized protein n=1 Tax=Portunus trituberculatus TaxID=210409 RepID=A0A5B7HCS0_PORTR|nr:hypothetical protein [Portunus trituberculatus]